jgi:hypothetical protein
MLSILNVVFKLHTKQEDKQMGWLPVSNHHVQFEWEWVKQVTNIFQSGVNTTDQLACQREKIKLSIGLGTV